MSHSEYILGDRVYVANAPYRWRVVSMVGGESVWVENAYGERLHVPSNELRRVDTPDDTY